MKKIEVVIDLTGEMCRPTFIDFVVNDGKSIIFSENAPKLNIFLETEIFCPGPALGRPPRGPRLSRPLRGPPRLSTPLVLI